MDIVAMNETTKEILFVECKWSEKVDAKNVLKELKENAKFVMWKNKVFRRLPKSQNPVRFAQSTANSAACITFLAYL